jgi:hypothetical protein
MGLKLDLIHAQRHALKISVDKISLTLGQASAAGHRRRLDKRRGIGAVLKDRRLVPPNTARRSEPW